MKVPSVLEMLTFTKVWGSGVLGCCCHLQVPLRSQQGPRADPLPLLQIPIQESLIEFVDGGLNKLAAEAFQGRQGHECPVPCPSVLGGGWGWAGMGRGGVLGEFSSGPTAPRAHPGEHIPGEGTC